MSRSPVLCVAGAVMGAAARRLRVSVDYGAFPVWDLDGGGMVDPESLPIDAALVARLQEWANRFDETLDWDDPVASKTPSRAWRREFDSDGRVLARALQAELGPAYDVRFGDDPVT